MEDLRVGDVRTLPTGSGSAREADLVRGPAYYVVRWYAIASSACAAAGVTTIRIDATSIQDPSLCDG